MSFVLTKNYLPPGMGLLYWLKVKGLVRKAFCNPQNALWTLLISACLVFVFVFRTDVNRLIMSFPSRVNWDFVGYGAFLSTVILVLSCFDQPLSEFLSSEVQWLVPSPWSRKQQVFYIAVRRVAGTAFLALSLELMIRAENFTLAFLKIFSFSLVYMFLPLAVSSVLYTWRFGNFKRIRKIIGIFLLILIAAPVLALVDLQFGFKSVVSLKAIDLAMAIESILGCQESARSFISADTHGTLQWLAGAVFLAFASFLVLLRFHHPWNEQNLARLENAKTQAAYVKHGFASRARFALKINLPFLPYWRGMGILIWYQTQLFVRDLILPLTFLAFSLIVEMAEVRFDHSKSIVSLISNTIFPVPTMLFVSVGLMFIVSSVNLRLERIKALPVSEWKIVFSVLVPVAIFLYLALQICLVTRLGLMMRIHPFQDSIFSIVLISLVRAIPCAFLCSTLIVFHVFCTTWIKTLSRSNRSMAWQFFLFFCRIGMAYLLVGGGMLMLFLTGGIHSHDLVYQFEMFGLLSVLASFGFSSAVWAFGKIDASSVES